MRIAWVLLKYFAATDESNCWIGFPSVPTSFTTAEQKSRRCLNKWIHENWVPSGASARFLGRTVTVPRPVGWPGPPRSHIHEGGFWATTTGADWVSEPVKTRTCFRFRQNSQRCVCFLKHVLTHFLNCATLQFQVDFIKGGGGWRRVQD